MKIRVAGADADGFGGGITVGGLLVGGLWAMTKKGGGGLAGCNARSGKYLFSRHWTGRHMCRAGRAMFEIAR
jgi:hypothetical protein